MMSPRGLLLMLACAAVVAGCEKKEAPQRERVQAAAKEAPEEPVAAAAAPAPAPAPSAGTPAAAGPVVELEISSVANLMAFDKTKLTVEAGRKVHLTFHNKATMTTLPHNWVLVKPGTEASVAAAGLAKGQAAGFLDSSNPDILAASPFAIPGQTTDFTFTAPAPGAYPYICTVPGHYMMMKGVLTVTPPGTGGSLAGTQPAH